MGFEDLHERVWGTSDRDSEFHGENVVSGGGRGLTESLAVTRCTDRNRALSCLVLMVPTQLGVGPGREAAEGRDGVPARSKRGAPLPSSRQWGGGRVGACEAPRSPLYYGD